ncbi:MAG: hypothetical protein JWM85_3184 [Acidimicrobiaceae bacterium]|nr:hypothetical protein [Acidimicrobiaceae bacterium]
MTLDPLLLELLVCPQDKGPLWYLADEECLYNPRLRRRYPIREGIPVLLVEEAEGADDTEHARLEALTSGPSARLTGRPASEGGASGQPAF